MYELSRTVRFCIDPSAVEPAVGPRDNTFAGWPSMSGLGAYYEFVVTCIGEPDSVTGYVLDIAKIDEAVRAAVVDPLRAAQGDAAADSSRLLHALTKDINSRLSGAVRSVRWRLTPYYSLAMQPSDPHSAVLRQMFDFAASHRLAVASFSDEQNLQVFGKCSNPTGHGHNYRLEAAVRVSIDDAPEDRRLTLQSLEAIVRERVLDRFDHRNLNEDLPEFAAVLPTVENIARVCFDLLDEAVTEAGGCLENVTVWETERTCSTYSRPVPARGG